jgi:hypothetical protein
MVGEWHLAQHEPLYILRWQAKAQRFWWWQVKAQTFLVVAGQLSGRQWQTKNSTLNLKKGKHSLNQSEKGQQQYLGTLLIHWRRRVITSARHCEPSVDIHM